MKDVAIIGAGMIDFGELYDQSLDDMAERAYLNAVTNVDQGLDREELEAAWFGTADIAGGTTSGASLAHATSLFDIPVTRIENACGTGSAAFHAGVQGIQSGAIDVALVVGAEKMHDSPGGLIERAAIDKLWRGRAVTMPAFFGLRATRHMHEFGTTREQIAQISVKNHKNGARYPHAHYQFECDVDDVLTSPMVTYPLNLYDCCPVTDGAAAVILASEDVVADYTDDPVWVAGYGQDSDSLLRRTDGSLTSFPATEKAAQRAYEMAEIQAEDIDVAEVHDCFTITELITYEDLGFCEKGAGGELISDGVTEIDGKKPVNPSGGLLAKGHPIGATGVAQIIELAEQLRGEAGAVQVENDPEYALQHNVGIGRDATGQVGVVTILSKHQ